MFFFIMDSTFVDTFDGRHPAVLPPKRCMKPNCSGVNYPLAGGGFLKHQHCDMLLKCGCL